jgi:hypothetical protein
LQGLQVWCRMQAGRALGNKAQNKQYCWVPWIT